MRALVLASSTTLAAPPAPAPPAPAPSAPPMTLAETRSTLVASARRRFGDLPADLVVDHVLRFTSDTDFAVREAALEALHRRWTFATRDTLVVATRPPGTVLGAYTTSRVKPTETPARAGRRTAPKTSRKSTRDLRYEARPYTSVLSSVAPFVASCDCPDFLRGSLGVCKHILVVLADVFAEPRRLARARREGTADTGEGPRLVWDPTLPLAGALDRMSGLRLDELKVASATRAMSKVSAEHWLRVRRALGHGGGVLASARLDLERRRDLLASLKVLVDGTKARSRLDASPAARALVAEELERATRAHAAAEAAGPALAALRTLKRRLYPYQREGVTRFLTAGRLLLADDMGLGKTTQAIAACHALFTSGRVKRGLVIAPASLKTQWLREWSETTAVPAAIVDGTPEERVRLYRGLDRGFLILNYEQLLRDAEHVQAIHPDIVVLDEAQRIKNYATKSAIYVKALTPEYRLVLTGTPMENRLEELASILDWVDDVALAPKWRLVPWHTEWRGDGGKGKTGARNLETLRARLAPSVVRRLRKDVLTQLPPRTDTRVPVEMTPQQRAEHDELVPPIARLVQTSKRRPLTQAEFLKLMQLLTQQRIIANGLGQLRFEELWPTYSRARPDATLLEGLFAPKLAELRRLVADLVVEQGRKIVVFSQWRRMLRLAEWSVRDLLADHGARAVFFTGAEKQSQRTRSVVDFHDDPQASVMFLSDAGGVGLNLQKAASACINLELPWNPAVLEQRIGRIYRLGQKRPIDVYNLVSESSIEGRIAGLLGAKQALFSGLFDGTSDEIRFDTAASFMTRVERLVDPGDLPEAPRSTVRSRPAADGDGDGHEADEETPATGTEVALLDAALGDDVAGGDAARTVNEVAPAPLGDPGHDGASAPRETAPATRDTVASFFAALRVEPTSDGGVRIEAPKAAAGALAALFEGMAKLLGDVR